MAKIRANISACGWTKGHAAYAALRAIAEDEATFSSWMREHFVDRAFMRASVDAEPSAWVPSAIPIFAHKHECEPETLADLMAIVMGRLGDISYALDNGDFSERDNVRAITKELEAQRWLAFKLREMARGMYSVTREEEVIARKETDIRVHHAKAGALTIEICPLAVSALPFADFGNFSKLEIVRPEVWLEPRCKLCCMVLTPILYSTRLHSRMVGATGIESVTPPV